MIVLRRCHNPVTFEPGRDLWWHEEIETADAHCPAEPMDSEAPLFILYTSGSTGKPKGVLHTTGGYLLGARLTTRYVFDLQPADVYWCTADVGWVTGHTYVVYGPLANGATVFLYEGAPNWPEPDRFWRMVDKHKVSILYTAPTAIRAFMKWGEQWPKKHDRSCTRTPGWAWWPALWRASSRVFHSCSISISGRVIGECTGGSGPGQTRPWYLTRGKRASITAAILGRR